MINIKDKTELIEKLKKKKYESEETVLEINTQIQFLKGGMSVEEYKEVYGDFE